MTPAPYHTDIAEGPEGGKAFWLTAGDGVRIRLGVWPGGDRGTVLMFPGRTEMVEKYGRVAAEFAARGYSSIAIDWRGQGIADRLADDPDVGHVGRFSDYQLDVVAVLGAVSDLKLPKPWFLMAHSMGGAIGLRALMLGLPVNAVCFSAPMWDILIPAHKRPQGWTVAWLSKKLGFEHHYIPGKSGESYVATAAFEDNELTTDPEMFAYMQRQLHAHPEMALGGASLGWLYEALKECRRFRTLPLPGTPALTWLGTNERIVEPSAIHQIMARWPNGGLEILDRGEHEVFFERPDLRNRIYEETCALFAAHS